MFQRGATTHSPCVTLCNKNHFGYLRHAGIGRRKLSAIPAYSDDAALLFRLAFFSWPRIARPPEWTPRPALAPNPIRGGLAVVDGSFGTHHPHRLHAEFGVFTGQPGSQAAQSRPIRRAPAPRSTAAAAARRPRRPRSRRPLSSGIIRSEIRYRSPLRPRSAASSMRPRRVVDTDDLQLDAVHQNGSLPKTAPAMNAPCGVRPQSPAP